MIKNDKNKAYDKLLKSLVENINISHYKVAKYVSSTLLFTYWNIGNKLNTESQRQGWGAKVVDQLAIDLKYVFPRMTGLSKRNLQYMMTFATEWPVFNIEPPYQNTQNAIVPQAVAQLQAFDNILKIWKVCI